MCKGLEFGDIYGWWWKAQTTPKADLSWMEVEARQSEYIPSTCRG